MWRKWNKQKEGLEKELKGCNVPLICLALNHMGMLENQCRLIATFTESAENTETNSVCFFLVLYLQIFLHLSHTHTLLLQRAQFIGRILDKRSWTHREMLELTLFDWLQCEWVCVCAASDVWLLSTAQLSH